jgi:hypothetical protein
LRVPHALLAFNLLNAAPPGLSCLKCSDEDPLFVNPAGADGDLGTQDDDLRLATGSPAIDHGWSAVVAADRFDADADGDLSEFVQLDGAGLPRFAVGATSGQGCAVAGAVVDLGAHEYQGTPTAEPCGLDADGDAVLGAFELQGVLAAFGGTAANGRWDGRFDLDRNGKIDLDDLLLALAGYGELCS